MGLSSKQVSGDGLEWSQGLFKDGEVEIAKPQPPTVQARQQRQVTGVAPPPLRCPRCDSNNTKFCYYNNYSRSQPRHFCKSCRRHWTNGGTLRNVPVGGGRKNKRPKTSHTSSTSNVFTDNGKQQQEQQMPTPFVPDHQQICQTLLHPSTSAPSSEYLTTNIGGSNGSSILGSLLSLPPMAPLAMTDPFYTSSYSFLPFMRNQLDDNSEKQDKINGLTSSSSSSMVDVGVGGLFQSTLLPTCSFANGNVLEPSSTGEYWNCWDELAGFGTPQPSGLPDLGRI